GKFYLAAVRGVLTPPDGILDAPIGRHPVDRQRMAVREGGRPARSRYHTLGACECGTLVVARLETGRTHQLRVHFTAAGSPIAGDSLYGKGKDSAPRLWLHSWRIAFTHPRSGQRLELEAPLPRELAESCGLIQPPGLSRDGEPLDR